MPDENTGPLRVSSGATTRDIAAEIAYVVEHGQSPEAEAVRVLRRFMTCKAGDDLVEHGLLRPYGYTLKPGRVVRQNRNLLDALHIFEVELSCVAQELHDGTLDADNAADQLARLCERMRREKIGADA